MIKIPHFNDVSKLHAWLIDNKRLMIDQKKGSIKHADAFSCDPQFLIEGKNEVIKSEAIPADATKIEVVSVINTTKIFDSHGDVHFDGLWDKAMRESKGDYLVKAHNFDWDGIITDQVKVSTPTISWKSLGFNYSGNTQALTYTSTISKADDPTGMFDRYAKGKVKEHSVGMRYIKVALALDNKRYEEEYKVWKNYYDQIANKADVDKAAYFWAVTEAKNIEGSAVVKGSNFATPTISVQQAKEEPSGDTPKPLHALNLALPSSSKSIYNLKI